MSDAFWKKLSYFTGLIAIAVFFGLVFFLANIEIKDLDLWLHIATGRYIVTNMQIPQVDVLSATIANQPWINHEWLFQIIIYLTHQLKGLDGLITLQVLTVGFTFLLLMLLTYDRERQFGPLFLLLLVLLVYQSRFTIRPDIFSILFLTLYMIILGVYAGKKRAIAWLFIVQVLWTNMHGYFIFGPVIIFISLLAEWMKRKLPLPYEWKNVGRLSEGEYSNLKITLAAVCVACLINPFFIKGAIYPLGVFTSLSGESKIFFEHIRELQRPIHWHSLLSLKPYFYYKLLIILSAISFVFNRRKLDIGAFLFWSIFLVFSLYAIRNMAFFAISSYYVMMVNFGQLTLKDALPIEFKSQKLKIIAIISLKAFLIIWMVTYLNSLSFRGYFDFDKLERKSEYGGVSLRNFPYKAVDFLVNNNVQGNFFNDFNSGAYLLGRAHPNIKVFIDGRTEAYGVDFFKRYQRIWKGDTKGLDEVVEQYQLTGAFLNFVYFPVPERTIRHLYHRSDWHLVYFEYDAAIFLRDVPQNKNIIEQNAINLNDWQPPEMDIAKIGARNITPYQQVNRAFALYSLRYYDKARQEAEVAMTLAPQYDRPYIILGKVALKEKSYQKAFENFRKAKLISPQSQEVRYWLAKSLYYLENYEDALKHCQMATDRTKKNSKPLFLLSLIYAKQQKYAQSLEEFEGAVSIWNEQEDALEYLNVLSGMNAAEWYEKAVKLLLRSDPNWNKS